jgi:hypothetical protein
MTSLLERLLQRFPSVKVENLFTEAVAWLFETRPEVCLGWLKDANLLPPERSERTSDAEVRISTQTLFRRLEHHSTDSRPDIVIEVHWSAGEEAVKDVVIIESKIGSREGTGQQLRRYAEHLVEMADFDSRTLLYMTRGYDPKIKSAILSGLDDRVCFEQPRWRDFYDFIEREEAQDAIVREVMTFMEEKHMAGGSRFSDSDISAISGVLRAFEIFYETLDEEVRAELGLLAGHNVKRSLSGPGQIVEDEGYFVSAPLTDKRDLYCYAGYVTSAHEGYPTVYVSLEAWPEVAGREAWVAAMARIAIHDGWQVDVSADPEVGPSAWREKSLASFLPEKNQTADVKHFFIESIHQLREDLAAFQKERPDLPWDGE